MYVLYVQLRTAFENPSRYKLTPIYHMCLNMIERGLIPRGTWNYVDESQIGRAALLADTVIVPTLSTTTLDTYRVFDVKRD